MDLIIGHHCQVNGSYMINNAFLSNYSTIGDEYLKSRDLKKVYGVNYAQALYEI